MCGSSGTCRRASCCRTATWSCRTPGRARCSTTAGLPAPGADQFLNAAAVASSGAGLSLVPADATSEAVAGAVTRLLGDPSFGDAAGRIRDSIAAMPSPDDVAAVLEAIH